ncbi:uncharacterized protein N7482_008666 [Penicillium canariense]|uniref:Ubiquitin-like domain-containing protein n=1 Tax=Penicillium canariense TaxID=189055 RepID=A0A9W9HX14_9EURO|nr:uncharacterized protein N7482_008666 [Penicillium canariense]KAJ5157566.1 hypothetical protein N7482_008666 [Penicillium canariense]
MERGGEAGRFVGAERDTDKIPKALASEFAENTTSEPSEESREPKRPRISDGEEKTKKKMEKLELDVANTPLLVEQTELGAHHKRPISPRGSRPESAELDEDGLQPSVNSCPSHGHSIGGPSTIHPNVPSSPKSPDDASQQRRQRVESTARDTIRNSPSRYSTTVTTHPPAHPLSPPMDNPIVHILITSEIPNTKPLLAQRKMSQALKDVRLAWCERQGFTPEATSSVHLTWRGRRVFDVTTCRSLGIKMDKTPAAIDDDPLTDQIQLQIHMEAVTNDPLLLNRPGSSLDAGDPSPARRSPGEEQHDEPMKLILRSPGLDDFKIKARPKTSVSKLISAFRDRQNIRMDQTVSLLFDGDRLDPNTCLGDHDIADLDMVEVLVK